MNGADVRLRTMHRLALLGARLCKTYSEPDKWLICRCDCGPSCTEIRSAIDDLRNEVVPVEQPPTEMRVPASEIGLACPECGAFVPRRPPGLVPLLQSIRGLCSDEVPYELIDAGLVEAIGLAEGLVPGDGTEMR